MESQRLGDYIVCNPTVKLKKGQQCQLTDIDSITIGQKYPISKGLVIYDGQSGSKFSKGDTIMARITPCLENGKIAMYNGEEDSIGSTELFVFRGKEGVSTNEFVYYFFKQDWIRNYAANSMTGASGRQRADIKFIQKAKVQFPPLATQQKVASILSAYDSQIENNQKRIKLLEQMAENLYKEWFVRFRFPDYETAEFEGGVPKGWKVVKVKECVDRLRFGTLYGKDSVESDGDVIVIDQSQEPYIGFHNNAPSHIADTQKPIILFGDHSCKFELMIIPFSLAENVVPFVAKSGIDTTFLYFTTHNLIQTTEYKRHWTEFVNKKILLPPANLQREYAKKVIDILSMKQQLIVENRLLSKQRDLLLPRLMSGKLSI